MQNARLAEAQAGIKISGRNINNLIHADDLTLMAESKLSGKVPDCWERLKAGREGDDRGRDSWMASPTQWT